MYTLSSVTGRGQVKYMASPFFDFYMTALAMFAKRTHTYLLIYPEKYCGSKIMKIGQGISFAAL